ncbi:MAG TPA: hypothetical protein PKD34_03275 [Candidatus Doudnabacteria bacterium]|nr:hypothetical protein [Candidatus Doudnabacteria bacterium]
MSILENFNFLLPNQLALIIFESQGDYYLMLRDGRMCKDSSFPDNPVVCLIDEYADSSSHRSAWDRLVSRATILATQRGIIKNRSLSSMLAQAKLSDSAITP